MPKSLVYDPTVQLVRQMGVALEDPTLDAFCWYDGPELTVDTALPGPLQPEELAREVLRKSPWVERSQEVSELVVGARTRWLRAVSRPLVRAEIFISEQAGQAEIETGVLVRGLGYAARVLARGHVDIRMIPDAELKAGGVFTGIESFTMTDSRDAGAHPIRVVRLNDCFDTVSLMDPRYAAAADWREGLRELAHTPEATYSFLHDEIRRLDPDGEYRSQVAR